MKKKRRSSANIVHFVKQNGRLNIEGLGAWYNYWNDPYHLLLTIPWAGFLTLICCGYIFANALFALAYIARRLLCFCINSNTEVRPTTGIHPERLKLLLVSIYSYCYSRSYQKGISSTRLALSVIVCLNTYAKV